MDVELLLFSLSEIFLFCGYNNQQFVKKVAFLLDFG